MTRANRTGVRSGTTSSRGVRAASWKRRLASVATMASGSRTLRAVRRGASVVSAVMAVIAAPFGLGDSGGLGEAVAGEPEVDVVERRPSRADRGRDAELVDRDDRVAGGAVVQRHGEAGADDERGRGLGDASSGVRRLDTPEPGVDVEVAPAAERPVDNRVLEDDAADATSLERLAHDVEAAEAGGAAGGGDRGREHADRRRLAGAVRAEQAEHLAGGDLEVDLLDGLDAARIGLAELAPLDRGLS